ncbi:MAG TPA: copper homeostasis periplasmic binding protein CopC [Rhizomicrobium sp.]|nr:copper homeostasis periplasmic binding protein CopC [Rhizomicrobium sp.]
MMLPGRSLVVAAAVLYSSAAAAHAMLEHAHPSAGAVLHQSPATLQLQFSEQLEPLFSGATVTDPRGQSAAAGAATIQGTTITVPLKPLPAGAYRVRWHAVSVDTHRTEGSYAFTVAP